ncbi:MAG: (Fe-S)-binding protein [Syntrophorhabdales bacterium]
METVAPFKEVIDEVKEKGGDAVKFCYQCGKCDTVCPWNKVRRFSMRKLIREATFGLSEIEKEEIWRCTTCGKCPQRCPRDVKQIDDMVALRRMATGYGVFPSAVKPYRTISAGLTAQGNPFNEDRKTRADWAEGLSVKPFAEGMEILYFPGCYLSYDPRLKKVARATAAILKKAGVDFGILGAKESCCGESIRKTGNEDLFKRLAKENIKTFIDNGVIYHDPCYLGRHNGIYDEPRHVLKKIPGLRLSEFSESREDALCCGMGGGRIWAETPKNERFVNFRTEEAVGIGAEEVVTACPYCITNFEDSRAVLNYSDVIQIKDITEILQEVI